MSTDRSTEELLRAQRAKDVVHDDDVRAWANYAKQGRRDKNVVSADITAATDFDVADGTYVVATFGASAVAELGFVGGDSDESQEWVLELTNGGQGTLTWGSEVEWPGGSAPTLTAAGVDLLRFYSPDGSVRVLGTLIDLDYS